MVLNLPDTRTNVVDSFVSRAHLAFGFLLLSWLDYA